MIPLLRCDHGFRETLALASRLFAAGVDRLELDDGTEAIAFNRGRWAITVLLARACADQPYVIVPSFLCTAVAEAVLAAGKRPRFVDVGSDLNLDPAAVAAALDDDVAAIVVPHVYGAAAEIEAIARMGAERGVLVIDDAASAMGIEHGGKLLGGFGDAGVFSAAQQKSLVAGQGGLLVCNSDRARAAMDGYAAPPCGRLRAAREALRWQWSDRWHHRAPTLRHWVERVFGRGASTGGSCGRLPGVYAAVLAVQRRRLAQILARRRRNAAALFERLRDVDGVEIPQYREGCALARFAVRTPGHRWQHDERGVREPHPLAARLREAGIACARPYVPLHQQARFADHAPLPPLPRTEQQTPELVLLPVQGKLSERSLDRIGSRIKVGIF